MTTTGTPTTAPATAPEAERRFFARYGEYAGTHWAAVQGFLGIQQTKPTTVEGWIAIAEQTRQTIRDLEATDSMPETNPALDRIAVALERIATSLERLSTVPATPKPSEPQRGADGIPICPKHNQRMKVSNYGGYFCTAADPDTKNGKCVLKVKE